MTRRRIRHNFGFFGSALLSLAFLSCGSVREACDFRIDRDTMERIEAILNEITEGRSVDVRKSDLRGDITIREREFDTDKPVDPDTGERPLVREIETNIHIEGADSVFSTDTVSRREDVSVTDRTDDKVKVDVESEVERRTSKWPVAVIFLSVFGILIAVIYLLRRINII